MVKKTKICVNDGGLETEICIKTQQMSTYGSRREAITKNHKDLVENIIKAVSSSGCGYIQDFKIK